MNNIVYNIFGSHDSTDIDVMVYLDDIPKLTDQGKKLCFEYAGYLSEIIKTDRKIDCNLSVLKDGLIQRVVKGIPCETNNSIFYTYNRHEQSHPLMIERPADMKGWKQLKSARILRILLSFLSRTEHRKEVKKALKLGSTEDKIRILYDIRFVDIDDFFKKESKKDIWKTIAFQLGQGLGLYEGMELYSKDGIASHYPSLRGYLYRQDGINAYHLDVTKNMFLEVASLNLEEISE